MTRDDVVIVLNERQTLKAERAAELLSELERHRLSCTRLTPSEDVISEIVQRNPRVVVLDYLLGDFTTAIEVLQQLKESVRPQIAALIWTDERSLSAAVSAMKLGARDFIELEPARSLQKVVSAVLEILSHQDSGAVSRAMRKPDFSSRVYQSASSRACRALALRRSAGGACAITLLGPAGAGRDALAEEMHGARVHAGSYAALDFDLWAGSLDDIFGDDSGASGILADRTTLFIDHVEADHGELLERAALWTPASNRDNQGAVLIAGTTSPDHARAWKRLANAEIVELPSLAERADDFLPLTQLSVPRRAGKSEPLAITAELISGLQALHWPGNLKQFICAVADAGSLEAIQAAKLRWERFEQPLESEIQPLRAARALLSANGSFRVAAVLCGTTVPGLRKALFSSDEQFLKSVLAAGSEHE